MYQKIHNIRHTLEARRILRNNPTLQEDKLWQCLRDSQTGYKFRRQHGFGPYIVDFYCPQKKLIIEIDGSQHNDNSQIKADNERTLFFKRFGYEVIRFWNAEVDADTEAVVEKIKLQLNLKVEFPSPGQGEGRTQSGGVR
ncbi:MAG: endonuclease domain-containing protein [Candidatus Taylorbacteria bacterium]|nr:endonuclease domain-containing protein [Candidatus Taylorbacteria bacterium]